MPKMEFLRKRVGQQRYPNHLYGSPPSYYVHIGSMGNPLITDTDKHDLFTAVLLPGFKNRHVNANINL